MKAFGNVIVGALVIVVAYWGGYYSLVRRDEIGPGGSITLSVGCDVWFEEDDEESKFQAGQLGNRKRIAHFYEPEVIVSWKIGKSKAIVNVTAHHSISAAKAADIMILPLRGPMQVQPTYRIESDWPRTLFSVAHCLDRMFRPDYWSYSSYRRTLTTSPPPAWLTD